MTLTTRPRLIPPKWETVIWTFYFKHYAKDWNVNSNRRSTIRHLANGRSRNIRERDLATVIVHTLEPHNYIFKQLAASSIGERSMTLVASTLDWKVVELAFEITGT